MTTPNGYLLVDKPSGVTSHDVVASVRKIMGERRVGHAGTLDPMATGLLIVAVGPSTRLLRFCQSEVKRYRGTVQFGAATDSLDADGRVTSSMPVPDFDEEMVNVAAKKMTGAQLQVPPMVSALKVDGTRLHELARQGIEIERDARAITVESFTLRATDERTRWDFDVVCSTGTYVRVLLSDLAVSLSTLGHLIALRREASGRHMVTDALSLDGIARRVEYHETVLRAPLEMLGALERVVLDEDAVRRMRMGQRLALETAFTSDEVAAIDQREQLVGVLARRAELWQPALVMAGDEGPVSR